MISLGRLDRQGTVYHTATAAGVGGAPVDQLVPIIENLWVTKVTLSARAIVSDSREGINTHSVFMCRWFHELKVGMLFECDGQRYLIARCDELGRREGWQFYGEAIT